ncbi:MAG: hypothetical protein A2143_00615 [Gallionellales bacterium RBG_16_57_15]|nr:MAG: hypothetical protein A2143_00615 [Gallionellales bacterium RBG_16_57_15]
MKTYILNLYYPSLKEYAGKVSMAKDFVEDVAGKSNYRVIRAGESICSLAFATDADPADFERQLDDLGESQFQYLLVEICGIPAGWTDKSVYQWLRDRLCKGSEK